MVATSRETKGLSLVQESLRPRAERKEMKTQRDEILQALMNGERLTKIAMLSRFRCWNSGNIIFLLRRDGYDIKTTMKIKGKKCFAEYSLETA